MKNTFNNEYAPETHVESKPQDKKTILYVDACPRKESRTRILADHLLQYLDGSVNRLALAESGIRSLGEKDVIARDKILSEGKEDADILSYAREFALADEIVIAAPFWDLSFPALLKSYIENVNVCGVTFEYDKTGRPVGLCRAKRLFYVTTSGGMILDDNVYGYGYIKTLCHSFYGISETYTFTAEELDIEGVDLEGILERAKEKIDQFFRN